MISNIMFSFTLQQALNGVSLHDSLAAKIIEYDTRPDGSLKPEGAVRIEWIRRLIQEYGFESKQIDIEVPAGRVGRAAENQGGDTVFADVVVYRDILRTEPFIVIETKKPDEKTGIAQAESYSRNLGSEYHVWHDGKHPTKFFLTSRFVNKSGPVSNIPSWVGTRPVAREIPKSVFLPPFRDENHMRDVVHVCHEVILEKQGHDPAKAFDELTKLLFLKLYDEREVPSFYKFVVRSDENEHDLALRLRQLFGEAIRASRYRDVFSSRYTNNSGVVLELDDFTILQIVQLLQGYSLINTTTNIHGADIKGTVFEQMVGNTFRGELAQFFTPREIVQCIVDMIPPKKESKVFDPSCGSGGFLVMAIRSLTESLKLVHPNLSSDEIQTQVRYFAERKLFGSDINDRMARVAKMNMIMHGDGHTGIVNTNGLLTDHTAPEEWLRELRFGGIDIIYSNPPFAGREKDPDILNRFDLGKNRQGEPRTITKEALFIELIIKLLAPGGRAGLVLPAGVFNNPSMKEVRSYIKSHVKILALVGLPHLAFQISGANNEGHLLFIEKVDDLPKDYDVFIDWAAEVGFDSVGRKTERNDLLDVLKRFRRPSKQNIIRFSKLGDRIDPWYYHPNYKKIIDNLHDTCSTWTAIGNLVCRSTNFFARNEHQEDEVIRYIEKGDVDLETGQIMSFSEHTVKTLPSRATYVLQTGDILFADVYDCMRGVAVVPPQYNGYVATNRFFACQHNHEVISLEYLIYHFLLPEILALIKRECSGEINPGITWDAFSRIKIPLPLIDQQREILKRIEKISEEKEQLIQAIAQLDAEANAQLRTVVPALIHNYEEIKIIRAEFIANALNKEDAI